LGCDRESELGVNRTFLIGAGGLAIVAVAVLAASRGTQRSASPPVDPSVFTDSARSGPVAAPAPPLLPPVAVAGKQAPSSPAASESPTAAPPSGAPAPSFDVVRVNPSGYAVIAGRAAPGAKVTVLDGDAVIGQALADGRGEWALVPEKPLAPGNRSLSLSAELPGHAEKLASAGDVLIAVPQPRPNTAGQPGEGASTALALLVPHGAGDIARPLQVPSPSANSGPSAAAAEPSSLALDIIEYDAAGRVALAGRAEPGTALNLYLGGDLIAQAKAGNDGRWTAKPDGDVAPGVYRLRLDQLGEDGKVIGRLVLPFQRAQSSGELADGERFTVQPGNSLWRIARKSYGAGTRYAVIYAANRDRIADPDLIYPGQIVKLPATN
jgi:hypothetical protein